MSSLISCELKVVLYGPSCETPHVYKQLTPSSLESNHFSHQHEFQIQSKQPLQLQDDLVIGKLYGLPRHSLSPGT